MPYDLSKIFTKIPAHITFNAKACKPGFIGSAEKCGPGVVGIGNDGPGVVGTSTNDEGVIGDSTSGVGVRAKSETGEGIHAETNSLRVAAVAAFNLNKEGLGAAIYGKKVGTSGHAGFFEGNVHVEGDVHVARKIIVDGDVVLTNADCAEYFDVISNALAEPGTVMVLNEDGGLRESHQAYDKRVAGVISGAGDYKPGIVLDNRQSQNVRMPLALVGKVFCKVDASYGRVEIGDLLTTSNTPGHAMKASDLHLTFGAVIGKVLRPLQDGRGLIPILVTLQ
jgi:hypothetical protein